MCDLCRPSGPDSLHPLGIQLVAMPAGVSWARYLRMMGASVLAMFAGAQVVHQYYLPDLVSSPAASLLLLLLYCRYWYYCIVYFFRVSQTFRLNLESCGPSWEVTDSERRQLLLLHSSGSLSRKRNDGVKDCITFIILHPYQLRNTLMWFVICTQNFLSNCKVHLSSRSEIQVENINLWLLK